MTALAGGTRTPLALYHGDGEYYEAVVANAADDPLGMAKSWATVAVRHLNTCNLIVRSCTTPRALDVPCGTSMHVTSIC
jgi:hypothetical protein